MTENIARRGCASRCTSGPERSTLDCDMKGIVAACGEAFMICEQMKHHPQLNHLVKFYEDLAREQLAQYRSLQGKPEIPDWDG